MSFIRAPVAAFEVVVHWCSVVLGALAPICGCFDLGWVGHLYYEEFDWSTKKGKLVWQGGLQPDETTPGYYGGSLWAGTDLCRVFLWKGASL